LVADPDRSGPEERAARSGHKVHTRLGRSRTNRFAFEYTPKWNAGTRSFPIGPRLPLDPDPQQSTEAHSNEVSLFFVPPLLVVQRVRRESSRISLCASPTSRCHCTPRVRGAVARQR
jgi:hypothetical protein